MTLYTVEIRDQYGRLVGIINRPMNKKFTILRNKAGSCTFDLDLFDSQASETLLKVNLYDIVLKRQGTVMFAGQISYVEPSVEGDTKKVAVTATGYLDLLDERYVTTDFPTFDLLHNKIVFNATDVGQACWNLINYSQFPVNNDGTQTLDGTLSFYQSFVASGSSQLLTLQLLLNNISATGNLKLEIYADNNGYPSVVQIGTTKTVAVSGIAASLGWNSFDMTANGINLTSGQKYWIRAYLDTAQSGSNGIAWAYLSGDYYYNGKAYCPQSSGLFAADQDLQFFVQFADNSWQMTKNTFMGINQGTITTSFNLTTTFDIYKSIKAAVVDMSTTNNGVDIDIIVQIDSSTNIMKKYFNVYYPRIGIDNTGLSFIYPGNIKKIRSPKDGKAMKNEIAVRGQGSGLAQPVSTVRDTSSIQTYFLRQKTQDEVTITDTTTLASFGNETLRISKALMPIPELTMDGQKAPYVGSYNIGDLIKVQSTGGPNPNNMLTFLNYYRIEQIDGTITDDDMEEIKLTLSQA